MMDDTQLAQHVRDTVQTLNEALKEAVARGIRVEIKPELEQKPGEKPTATVGILLTKTERLL